MSDEKKFENRLKLFKRRNSLPEIVIRKPKLIQVKSLDIPINVSANVVTSQFKTNVPKFLSIPIDNDKINSENQKICATESTAIVKKSTTNYEFEKLSTNNNKDLFESSNNSSTSNFYCKKCKMKQDFHLMEPSNLSSGDGEYEKVMPISIPELKINKNETKIQNPFTINPNLKTEIHNLKFLENTNSHKSDFNGIDKKDFNENNQTGKILRIQDYEDNISSTSYEPIDSKRTPTAEENSTDMDIDWYISDMLTKSLKDLPEGGGSKVIQKCKTQFMKPLFRNDKNKFEKKDSSNLNDTQKDLNKSNENGSCSNVDKKIEETHLFLNTNLLKQMNVEFVLLNFGSIYPPVSSDSFKIEPITRNLCKTQRTDSLEVQTSSTTRESSCSASDESSNNGCQLSDIKPVSKVQATLHSSDKNNEEDIHEIPEDTKTKQIQNLETKNSKKVSEKIPKQKNPEEKCEETHYVKINKQKYEKKSKTLSTYTSCNRVCPGRMEIHHNHLKTPGIHSIKNSKTKNNSISKAEKSVKTITSGGTVKKMTVFQTQSDIITPDIENGPKRFYQKTEINDDGKFIEILEIVECGENPHSSSSERFYKPLKIYDKPLSKSSSIQNPKKIKSLSESKSNSVLIPKTDSSSIIKVFTKDETTQTVPSPSSLNCIICRHQEKLPKSLTDIPLSLVKSPVNQTHVRRRNTPSRSGDSLKYHHPIFEVIPEEKSSSISTEDSSSEEQKKLKRNPNDKKNSTNNEPIKNTDNQICTNLAQVNQYSSNGSQDSDKNEQQTPEATNKKTSSMELWKLDQKRSIEDDDIYPSTGKTQTERSNQYTITSPSTVTANAGSVTPKNMSSTTFPTSSESCDLINPIAMKKSEQFISDTTTSSTTPVTISSCIQNIDHHEKQIKNTPIPMKKDENLTDNQIKKDQNSTFNTKTDYAWRVDGAFSDDNKNKHAISLHSSPGNTSSYSLTPLISFSSACKSTGPESICSRCCFCNPILHESSGYTDTSSCPYCNRKKTPKLEVAETNTECNLFCRNNVCSIPYHCCTSTSSDRTMTRCTQTDFTGKSQISNSTKNLNKNEKKIDKCKNVNKTHPRNLSHPQDTTITNVSQKCTVKNPKLRNNIEIKLPGTNYLSSYSTSENCMNDSSSTSSISPELEQMNPKNSHKNKSSSIFRRKHSRTEKKRKQDLKDVGVQKSPPIGNTDDNSTKIESNGRNDDETKSSGWSVTVTGSCQDLIPDVEMKLKFPQKSLSQLTYDTDKNSKCVSNDDENTKNDSSRKDNLALPSTKKQSSRCTSEDTSRSHSDSKLPDLSFTSRQQLIPSNVQKHSDKQSEFSNISPSGMKNSRIPRTMSYQIISTQSGIIRHGRNGNGSNFLEFDDITTHHHHHHSNRKFVNCQSLVTKPLTVTGNAIEPEQKPRVPTMSEKDLTRKHKDLNFTRNRSFYV